MAVLDKVRKLWSGMGERLKTESIKALEPKSWRAVDILQKSHFGATRSS